MSALREQNGLGAKALEFNRPDGAARSGEVRKATWDEIDLDNAVIWDDSSGANEGRQGASSATVADCGQAAESVPRIEGNRPPLPSTKNKALSDMTLTGVLRRMGVKAVRMGSAQHSAIGLPNAPTCRVRLRKWLWHIRLRARSSSYRRGDLFAKRVQMMSAWAKFCDSSASVGGRVVVFEHAARAARDR
jgi:integrase